MLWTVPPRRASLPSATAHLVSTTSNRVAPFSYWRTCTSSLPPPTPPEHERPQLAAATTVTGGGYAATEAAAAAATAAAAVAAAQPAPAGRAADCHDQLAAPRPPPAGEWGPRAIRRAGGRAPADSDPPSMPPKPPPARRKTGPGGSTPFSPMRPVPPVAPPLTPVPAILPAPSRKLRAARCPAAARDAVTVTAPHHGAATAVWAAAVTAAAAAAVMRPSAMTASAARRPPPAHITASSRAHSKAVAAVLCDAGRCAASTRQAQELADPLPVAGPTALRGLPAPVVAALKSLTVITDEPAVRCGKLHSFSFRFSPPPPKPAPRTIHGGRQQFSRCGGGNAAPPHLRRCRGGRRRQGGSPHPQPPRPAAGPADGDRRGHVYRRRVTPARGYPAEPRSGGRAGVDAPRGCSAPQRDRRECGVGRDGCGTGRDVPCPVGSRVRGGPSTGHPTAGRPKPSLPPLPAARRDRGDRRRRQHALRLWLNPAVPAAGGRADRWESGWRRGLVVGGAGGAPPSCARRQQHREAAGMGVWGSVRRPCGGGAPPRLDVAGGDASHASPGARRPLGRLGGGARPGTPAGAPPPAGGGGADAHAS
ncbi:hypothetical protein BU14_0239s0010, partial [Porphyra umbilicalis]